MPAKLLMDNFLTKSLPRGATWPSLQFATAHAQRAMCIGATLLLSLWVSRSLAAMPFELGPLESESAGEPPIPFQELPASFAEYVSAESPHSTPAVVSGEGSRSLYSSETHDGDAIVSPSNTYGAYARQPSRPDRWEMDGPQFPWLEFPGFHDDWRVGPALSVRADGLFLDRTNVSSDFLGIAPPFEVKRFGHAGGARAYLTSQNLGSYAVQVGYVGASDWTASALDQISNVNETLLNSYDSSLHAVELNLLPASSNGVQWLVGTRFVGFDEDVSRLTDRVNVDLTNNTATGLDDELSVLKIDNRLIGAQLGMRRDIWSQNQRFSLESLLNGGPFCNLITRDDIDQTYVTVNPPDDPGTTADESLQTELRVDKSVRRRRTAEFAFFGEAALTAVYRFHPNASARAGYQAVWLTGAHLASDSFRNTSTVFFHGLHWGLEYRR